MKIIGNDKALRTPEFHKQKLREQKVKIALYSVLTLLILIAPFVILRSHRLLVTNIHVVGNDVTKEEDIQKIVAADLEGSYWYIIPRSSTIFYPRSKIMADIATAVPRIQSVDAHLTDIHTMEITIVERGPAALYCTNTSIPNSPKGCYFVDNMGYIFSEAPAFSGGVYSVYTSTPLIEEPLKKKLFEPEDFKHMESFLKSLANIPLHPEVLTIEGDEYSLLVSSGTKILWKKSQDLDAIYSNLDSFILNPSVRKQGIGNLLYIDLRVDNKVFYKFQGE